MFDLDLKIIIIYQSLVFSSIILFIKAKRSNSQISNLKNSAQYLIYLQFTNIYSKRIKEKEIDFQIKWLISWILIQYKQEKRRKGRRYFCMNPQDQFLLSVEQLLDKYFQTENGNTKDEQTMQILQDLEWEDIIEWANQYILKLKRIKNTTSNQEINQSICLLIKIIFNCFSRFTEEERKTTESTIIFQSLDLLVKNNFKSNIDFCLALTQIIVEEHPQNLEILYLLCNIYTKTKQFDEATKYITKCKELCQTQVQNQNILELEQHIQKKKMSSSDDNGQQVQDSQDGLRQSCFIDINSINFQIDSDSSSKDSKKKKDSSNSVIDSEQSQPSSPEKKRRDNQIQNQQKILYYNDEWEEADRYGYFQLLVYSYKKLKSKLGSCQKRKKNPQGMFPQTTQPTQFGLSANEISQQKTNNQSENKSPDKIYRKPRTDNDINQQGDDNKPEEP